MDAGCGHSASSASGSSSLAAVHLASSSSCHGDFEGNEQLKMDVLEHRGCPTTRRSRGGQTALTMLRLTPALVAVCQGTSMQRNADAVLD